MMRIFRIAICFICCISSGFLQGQNKVQVTVALTQPMFHYPSGTLFTREGSRIGLSLGLVYDIQLYKKLYLRTYCNFTNYNQRYKFDFWFTDSSGKYIFANNKVWQFNNTLEFGSELILSSKWMEFGGGIQYGLHLNTYVRDDSPKIIDGSPTAKQWEINYYTAGVWSIPFFLGAKFNRYTVFSMVTLALHSRVEIENVGEEYVQIYRVGLMVKLGKIASASSGAASP